MFALLLQGGRRAHPSGHSTRDGVTAVAPVYGLRFFTRVFRARSHELKQAACGPCTSINADALASPLRYGSTLICTRNDGIPS